MAGAADAAAREWKQKQQEKPVAKGPRPIREKSPVITPESVLGEKSLQTEDEVAKREADTPFTATSHDKTVDRYLAEYAVRLGGKPEDAKSFSKDVRDKMSKIVDFGEKAVARLKASGMDDAQALKHVEDQMKDAGMKQFMEDVKRAREERKAA